MGPSVGHDPAKQFAAGHQGADSNGGAQWRGTGAKPALGIGGAHGYTSEYEPHHGYTIMRCFTPNLKRNPVAGMGRMRPMGLMGRIRNRGSILIIVLWVVFGLCSI